jgi:AraC-like DNA-binding protein
MRQKRVQWNGTVPLHQRSKGWKVLLLKERQGKERVEPETTSVTSEREKSSEHQQALDLLLALTRKMAPGEGRTSTSIPFLSLIRHTHHIPPTPVVLTPAFCLILQGAKQLHLGQEILEAQAGDYLASMIALPAFAQITDATRSVPYFGLRLDFTIQEVASVVMEADIAVKPQEKKLNTGALIGRSDTDLLDICIRLLKLLNKPQEARFLSALLKREMLFHLLSGDGGHFFFQAALFDQQADGIGKVIAWIREHYMRSFTIEELATSHHMSVSGLHHQFKAITSMGPLQYQKHLRLQEARRLMLSGSRDATAAASDVGYTSLSQFSRDYRRLFGLPPLQDIKAMRNHATAGAFEQREGVYGDQRE